VPEKGFTVVTLPDDIYQRGKDFFRKHKKELRARRIRSVSALFQEALIYYMDLVDEAIRNETDLPKKKVTVKIP